MQEGDDRPTEERADAGFEEAVQRIEAEIRAVFDAYGERAGAVPERLIRLAQELERLRDLKNRRAGGATAPARAEDPPDEDAPRENGRAAGRS